jgi:photosystem II stability/assembly factor-like uncharacterized protein
MRVPALIMLFAAAAPWWTIRYTGRDTNLRGVSLTQDSVWVAGSNGAVLRSTDDGKTWQRLPVPGGEGLDFRDIEAFSADLAYVMSSGERDQSRIYKTTDGGRSWKLQYCGQRPGFFLDSLACDSPTHCVAISDPVDSKFLILLTGDGEHWQPLSDHSMPAALPGEGAFAASGTAIALCGPDIIFGTGGPAARLFRSSDGGQSWTVSKTPLAGGNASSGIFSIACGEAGRLLVVGGDYKGSDRSDAVAAYSRDSGKTWRLSATQPTGYRSAVTHAPNGDWVAVGLNGTDISHDGGVHWERLDTTPWNAIASKENATWAVGPKGTIARAQFRRQSGCAPIPRQLDSIISRVLRVAMEERACNRGRRGHAPA